MASNCREFFLNIASTYSSQTAFVTENESLTFQEVHQQSDWLASFFLNKWNLKKGDCVLVQMPNVLSYPVVIQALFKSGLVLSNSNFLYTKDECKKQFDLVNPKALVTTSLSLEKWQEIIPNKFPVLRAPILGQSKKIKNQALNFIATHIKYRTNIPVTDMLEALLIGKKKPTYATVDIRPNDTAVLQCTGGTTGGIKAAELTHKNLLSNVDQIKDHVEKYINIKNEVCISPLPLYHIFAFTTSLLAFPSEGMEVHLILNPRDIKKLSTYLSKNNWKILISINTLLQKLLEADNLKIKNKNKKACIAGGMALDPVMAQKWRKKTTTTLVEGYGLTEASPVVCINPINDKFKVGSIGMPLKDTELKLKKEKDSDEVGELCIKGPQIMKGYYNDSKATKNTLQDGWLLTGDMAKIDKDKFVFIVDRKKDMILVSGFNVYPSDVEGVLNKHSGISESAVIGVKSSKTGEAVHAFVVKKDTKLTEEDIKVHCKKYLASYKLPRKINFLDNIPKSPVGKILKKELPRYSP